MKHLRRLTLVGLALTGLSAATPKSSGDHRSYLTFDQPVALPGIELAAGTYVFNLPAAHDGSIVRVSSRDGSKVFLTAFTRIVTRPPLVSSEGGVTLGVGELSAGQAARLLIWYPADAETGREFIHK